MSNQSTAHAYNLHLGQPDMHVSNISAVTIDNVVLPLIRLRPLLAQATSGFVNIVNRIK